MGLIVIAAVDHRGKGRSQLDHGYIVALSEGAGRKLRHAQRIRIEYRRGVIGLSGKIDIRLQAEVKDLLILQIILIAEHGSNLHQRVVAGEHQRTLQRDDAMARPLRAFDSRLSFHHRLSAVTEEGRGIRNHAQLQGRRHHHRLGGRSRLIAVADAEIPPHLVPGVQKLLLRHGVLLLLGEITVLHQVVRIVQIIVHIRSHGQDLAVLGIHHHHADILRRRSFHILVRIIRDEFVDIFLHDSLQGRVDSRYHCVSVRRLAHVRGLLQILVQILIASSVRAVQGLAVLLLDAGLPLISRHGIAQHMAGQGIVGIAADIGVLEPDALDLRSGFLILLQGLKSRNFILCQLPQQDHIAAACIFIVSGAQLRRVQLLEALDQGLQRSVHIAPVRKLLLILSQHPGVQHQVVHLFAGGQNRAVPVQDISPPVGEQRAVRILLGQHFFRKFLSVCLIDIGQTHIYRN